MSKRLYHILIINWQDVKNPQSGGAEVHLHEIFKRLAARGHQVTLLCCTFPGCQLIENIDGIQTVRCGGRNTFNFNVKKAYRNLCTYNDFDIVIDDINKIPFFTPRFVKEPLLALVHHFFGKSIFLETGWLAAQYVYQTEKMVPRIYKDVAFAAVSQSTKNELQLLGISSVQLMPNGIEIENYSLNPQAKNEKLRIGYLGRMKKYKSPDHVIQAMPDILKAFPTAELVMIGAGDFMPELKRLTATLNITGSVQFTGYVDHDKKVELLNTLSVVVNPSPKEGWGQTVLEANACGAPVVAADSPGLRDSVQDGKTGILYPFGDTKTLAKAVISLSSDDEKRIRMSQAARQWAERWSWDESADRAEEIIQSILTSQSMDS